ncbi:thioesterase family protein [uncultured Sphingomonas sp.]|jgi:acyl-CoA thioester hydrolase|uniref:acyl-CoA thioesterase n=1 Tax=uncultured Sphingomonas sp. TaxID=158754 RepID=UPI002613C924|nr:thioesterase family protein [uncultured Sphingomonas sp.]
MISRPVFETSFEATPGDIDELGHVNNAVWVRWIQEAAVAHWYAGAHPAHVATYVWVVMRHEIDYRRGLGPGGRVTARTWVEGSPVGARFDRIVEFVGDDAAKPYVRARTTWAILDRATGRPVRIPSEVAAPFLSAA